MIPSLRMLMVKGKEETEGLMFNILKKISPLDNPIYL